MDDLGIIGVRKNYEKMQSEMFRCSLETGLPLPTTWSEDEWRKFFQWLSKQGDKGDSGKKTETTCEFKLKGHRGYEDQYDIEKRMCASEMGLNDPEKWSFYDWEVFVNWQDVFHGHDIVSGPDAKRLSDEKEARAKRARDWFDKHKDLYCYKKNDNTNENKKQNNSVMEEQNSKQEKVITIPEGWEVKNIDGQNIVIVEKENEVDRLPKTWNECLKILGEFENLNAYNEVVKSNISNYIEHGKEDYKILPVGLGEPMLALSQLLICRNAWWKELNWNPYVGERETSFCIVKNYSGQVDRRNYDRGNIRVLMFPTGDVRDKFLRTFKDLIKKAKDLL